VSESERERERESVCVCVREITIHKIEQGHHHIIRSRVRKQMRVSRDANSRQRMSSFPVVCGLFWVVYMGLVQDIRVSRHTSSRQRMSSFSVVCGLVEFMYGISSGNAGQS